MTRGGRTVRTATSPWLHRWMLLGTALFGAITSALPASDVVSTPASALYQSPNPNSNITTLGYPSAFQADVHYGDEYPPLNILGIFLNLINAAYQLSPYGFRKTWRGEQGVAPLSEYTVGISFGPRLEPRVETVSNRFVMWGIWAMAIQIYRDRKFKPCAAVLYWHREPVGYLSVHTRLGRELAPTATAAGNEGATETMKPMSVASQGNASSLMADDGLRILFEYGEHTLSSLDLFLAAFPVLTAVAEKGADYQCAEFRVEGYNTPDRVGFAVQADQDARGNVKLKYEHVRKAVQQIIFSMVVHKRFKNVRFVVELDGVKIGHGEWTKKPAAETSPTIGGSATA